MVPGIVQTTGRHGCVCSSEADEVLGAAAGREQTSPGGGTPTQEQDENHGTVSLELGTALCPGSYAPPLPRGPSSQDCSRDWIPSVAQISVGHVGLRPAGCGPRSASVGPPLSVGPLASVFPFPVARGPVTWQVSCSRDLSPRIPNPEDLSAPVLPQQRPCSCVQLCCRACLWVDPPAKASWQARLSP